MSKHTPGPWEWYGPNLLCGGERQSENILNSADDGKRYGHHAALIEHHWDSDVAKANARLIAAAPELLEALRMFVVWYGLRDKHDTLLPPKEQEAELAQAMRAIAKATGAPE